MALKYYSGKNIRQDMDKLIEVVESYFTLFKLSPGKHFIHYTVEYPKKKIGPTVNVGIELDKYDVTWYKARFSYYVEKFKLSFELVVEDGEGLPPRITVVSTKNNNNIGLKDILKESLGEHWTKNGNGWECATHADGRYDIFIPILHNVMNAAMKWVEEC